ncbi:AraC family transcriptional regulator [Winogradskyella sp.]|uniref:AraC family transcriptional regulator n=1 Tax=Winogradskyella sp. TaxID=1883156 RepID=UPI0025F27955|nr:AraC family transcriptional regulator [Winogradskyella sp.]MCT4630882.1 AraC family transcriptional regulator [Winogradskyella sp.]
MKVLPFVIPKPNKLALIYQIDKVKVLYDKLHQHEEIQLSYIVKGCGTLVVGDTINNYREGDMLVIGSNVPHVFKSDESIEASHMLSLFFTKQSFGDYFFELEDIEAIQPFFERSIYGFKPQSHIEEIRDLFLKLESSTKFERFLLFLKLLHYLVNADYVSLSSFVYDKKFSLVEGDRMRNVFEYTLNNYDKNIFLEDIAEVANMTKNAFCKYFKKRTNKTYIQFLNEFRVENACKLMREGNDFTIVEIAYMCGFRNISNFNRVFRSVKRCTPSAYIKQN